MVAAVQFDNVQCYTRLLSDPRVGVNDVVTTSGGHRLLHWAVMCNNIPVVSAIAEMDGVELNITNDAGESPLMLAVKNKNAVAVETLLRTDGVDIDVMEGELSLEDLARVRMNCTGRKDSRFRHDMSKVMLVLIGRARERRERERRERELREVRERARRRRVEQHRREQQQMMRRRQREMTDGSRDERLQEIIRREFARLELNDEDSEEVATIVDEDEREGDGEEYFVVMAAGETIDRMEQITGDPEVIGETANKTVITLSNKGTEDKAEENHDTEQKDAENNCVEPDDPLTDSVNEISKIVEKKIGEILSRLEALNLKILDRENTLKPLDEKHQKERQELKHKHVLEEGEHYTDFRTEIRELSENHEKQLEDLQMLTNACELNFRLHRTLHRLEEEENDLQKSQETRIIAMFVKHETEMKELRKIQKNEIEKHVSEDEVMKQYKLDKKALNCHLSKLTSKPEILPCPECPVCYESMRPPARILQCVNGHLTCVDCAKKVERFDCPTCKQEFSGRATAMEQFLRTLFNKE